MTLDTLRDHPWLVDLLWQTTAFLTLGLIGARLLRDRPAHAHAVLLAAVVIALVAPLLSLWARSRGFGLLAPASISGEVAALDPNLLRSAGTAAMSGGFWVGVACFAWAAGSAAAFIRLGRSLLAGRRLLVEATPLRCVSTGEAARRVADRLGLDSSPVLLSSRDVGCPVIWCWGRVPRVILPADQVTRSREALDGVLGHELAHWRRRDHLWSIVGELAVCLLPWSPPAWWARSALGRLSEQACDAWALAAGTSRTDLAGALLELVPVRRRTVALGAVSSRHALPARIERILEQPRSAPRVGRAWTAGIVAVATLAAVGGALAHRPTDAASDRAMTIALDDAALVAPRDARVVALPGELDLGVAPVGGAGHGTLWIVNVTDEPIELRAVKASCGCTTVSGFQTGPLAARSGMALGVTMTAPAEAGAAKTKKVTIHVAGQTPLQVPVHLVAAAPSS